MTEEVFNECLEHWKQSVGNSSDPFWVNLAEKYDTTVDAIRSKFKRERQKRGISKSEQRTIQQNPVVGVIDLETLPLKIEGTLWGIRDQYITYDMIKQNSVMLSWAGKYLYDSQMYSDVMNSKEALKYNSRRITKSLREFVDTCDIVIGHNWRGFDYGILNFELTRHELPPVKYRTIDTYSLIKSNYRLPSYKLDYVNTVFGIRTKVSHEGKGLWDRCVRGEEDALVEMLTYNEGDILANEELFWKIQPYCDNSIPNFGTYQDSVPQMCQCGSTAFKKEDRLWYTNLSSFERFACKNCGAVHRGRKNLLSKDKREGLMVRL